MENNFDDIKLMLQEVTLHDEIIWDSKVGEVMRKIEKDFSRQLNDRVQNYLRYKLIGLGYTFSSDKEFIEFASKRIHRVASPRGYFKFFLDFQDMNNVGVPLGGYYHKSNIFADNILESNKVTAELKIKFD